MKTIRIVMLTNGTSGETSDNGDKNVRVKSFDENGMPFYVRGDVAEVFSSETFPDADDDFKFQGDLDQEEVDQIERDEIDALGEDW
jgi:hypothetical protein